MLIPTITFQHRETKNVTKINVVGIFSNFVPNPLREKARDCRKNLTIDNDQWLYSFFATKIGCDSN